MSKHSLAAGITQTWLFLPLVLCCWLNSHAHGHMDPFLAPSWTLQPAQRDLGVPCLPLAPCLDACSADHSQPVAPLPKAASSSSGAAAWRQMLFRAQLGYSLLPHALFPPWPPSFTSWHLGGRGRGASLASPSTTGCPSTWISVKPHICSIWKPQETWEGCVMSSTALGHRGEQGSAYCMPTLLGHSRGVNKRSCRSKCAIMIMIELA